jgi:PadR family transcriptional regulator PadR
MTESDSGLYFGLIRLHILHHAAQKPGYGSWVIKELHSHGYEISPGTLYPMLQRVKQKGYLHSQPEGLGKRDRRFYTITSEGSRALAGAKEKGKELFGEMFNS